MALAQVDAGLKGFEASYAERLHRWQTMAMDKIAQRVRLVGPGPVLEHGLALAGSVVELTNDLINLRVRIANYGRGQVTAELRRQETKNGAT